MFGASLVEAIEALVIVLTVALAAGWMSAAAGMGAAVLLLTVLSVVAGAGFTLLPIVLVRLVVGLLLLLVGLRWLRKGVFRVGRRRYGAVHGELPVAGGTVGIRWPQAAVAFKGVLLEGIEVVVIAVSAGAPTGRLSVAIGGALAAVALVALVGAVVHRPLRRVPENVVKLGVGVVLTTFGCFWFAEGLGLAWPGGDVALVGLLVVVACAAAAGVAAVRAGSSQG